MSAVLEPACEHDTQATVPRLDPQNPWPGLAPYDEAAHAWFQGRDDEAAALVGLVEACPVVSLYGKSGLGKSSLLQAGVFPRLRQRGFLPVYARLDFSLSAGSPWDRLAQRLCEAADAAGLERPARRDGEGLWAYLHRKDFELWTVDNHLRTPVLVLDQFEEVFSRPGTTRRDLDAVFDVLGDLVENRIPSDIASDKALSRSLDLMRQRFRVVLSFREDFLPDLRAWDARLPSLLRQSLRLLPMTRMQAVDAVQRAGQAVLAPGTAGPIVDFVAGDPEGAGSADEAVVEPVMLSLCCTQLNRRRPEGGCIDVPLLRSAGPNIIEDFYAEAMRGMPDSVHRFIEEQLLEGDHTRGSFARDEALKLGYIDAAQLQRLTSVHRLLRIDPQGKVPRIELIHDRLVDVVKTARDARRARMQAEEARRREDATRDRRAKYWIAGALAVVCVLLGVSIANTSAARRAAAAEREASDKAVAYAAKAEEAMAQAVASEAKAHAAVQEAQTRLRELTLLATHGWDGTSDPWLFKNAMAADTVISNWAQSEADVRRRRDTTVEITTQDIDEDHIRRGLWSLGFRKQAKRAVLSASVTNTLWYGSRADARDVKLVALVLMRDGIELRAIRPIPGSDAANGRAVIRAGAAGDVEHLARMTPAEVTAATHLPLP